MTINAIKIDPEHKEASAVDIPTEPLPEPGAGYGLQPQPSVLWHLLGGKYENVPWDRHMSGCKLMVIENVPL